MDDGRAAQSRADGEVVKYVIDTDSVARRAGLALLIVLGMGALFFWTEDFDGRILLGTIVALMLVVALSIRMGSMQFEANGDDFCARDLLSTKVGNANDFIGMDSSHAMRHWMLVRSSDLRVVRVPWLTERALSSPDREILTWLSARIPSMGAHHLRLIERLSNMPEGRARSLLDSVRVLRVVDYKHARQVSAAARAVWKFEYVSCRDGLHRLLRGLPHMHPSLPYVVEALRKVGNEQTVKLLHEVTSRRLCSNRNRMASALCDLASSDQRRLVEPLLDHEQEHIRRAARRAVARWARVKPSG